MGSQPEMSCSLPIDFFPHLPYNQDIQKKSGYPCKNSHFPLFFILPCGIRTARYRVHWYN